MSHAIHSLYCVFSKYKLPDPAKMSPALSEEQKQLYSGSKKQLTTTDFETYIYRAMTTWGDSHEFRHFLPRILELFSNCDQFNIKFDVEMIGSKLDYANWLQWPIKEIDAVEYFLSAWWKCALLRDMFTNCSSLDSYLCSLALARKDIMPFLVELDKQDDAFLAKNLHSYIRGGAQGIIKRRSLGAWWDNTGEGGVQFAAWLCSNSLHERIENAALNNMDLDWSESAMKASEILKAAKNWGN